MPSKRRVRSEVSKQIREQVHQQIMDSVTPKRELPDGIVAIVFTDVEGSTALVRDLGEERARAVLRRHDAIVRELLPTHAGVEVERAGDSFMLVFRTASQAVAFALELQDRCAAEPWPDGAHLRVRIGIDTGEVIPEEKGYFGGTVLRAARIADLAQGGEVLISQATQLLASGALAEFRETGEHGLKGVAGSHRLFEAVPARPELPA